MVNFVLQYRVFSVQLLRFILRRQVLAVINLSGHNLYVLCLLASCDCFLFYVIY